MSINDDHADNSLSTTQQIIADDLIHGDQITGDKIMVGNVCTEYTTVMQGLQWQ